MLLPYLFGFFDNCALPGLLRALASVGVMGPLLRWFESYLTGRTQSVVLDGQSSMPTDCSKAKRQVGLLHRHFHLAIPSVRTRLYKSPTLDYCAPLWDPHFALYRNKLEAVQQFAARIVTQPREISAEDLMRSLNWTNLATRRKQKVALCYCNLNNYSIMFVHTGFHLVTRGVHRTHTPRGTSTGYSAATIDSTDVASLPMQVLSLYCVHVWPYPRCGSDRLPYIIL